MLHPPSKLQRGDDEHASFSPSSASAQISEESRESNGAGLYSREFEEVLQLIARAEIDINSFVDLALNDQLRAKIVSSGSISEDDRAAIVQLIDSVKKDSELYPAELPEQGGQPAKLLSASNDAYSNATGKGPLSENHQRVLKSMF